MRKVSLKSGADYLTPLVRSSVGSHGSSLVTTIHDKGDTGLRSLVARLEGNDCFVVFGFSLKNVVYLFSEM
jgi:hypothetical protein